MLLVLVGVLLFPSLRRCVCCGAACTNKKGVKRICVLCFVPHAEACDYRPPMPTSSRQSVPSHQIWCITQPISLIFQIHTPRPCVRRQSGRNKISVALSHSPSCLPWVQTVRGILYFAGNFWLLWIICTLYKILCFRFFLNLVAKNLMLLLLKLFNSFLNLNSWQHNILKNGSHYLDLLILGTFRYGST